MSGAFRAVKKVVSGVAKVASPIIGAVTGGITGGPVGAVLGAVGGLGGGGSVQQTSGVTAGGAAAQSGTISRQFERFQPFTFSAEEIQQFGQEQLDSLNRQRELVAASTEEQTQLFNDFFGSAEDHLRPGIKAGFAAQDELLDLMGLSRPAIGTQKAFELKAQFRDAQNARAARIKELEADTNILVVDRNAAIAQIQQEQQAAEASLADQLGQSTVPLSGEEINNRLLSTPGAQAELKAGRKAIEAARSARGLLQSGETLKGLQEFGQNVASRRMNERLGQLAALAESGQANANQLLQLQQAGTGALAGLTQQKAAALSGIEAQEAQLRGQQIFGRHTPAAFGFTPQDFGQVVETKTVTDSSTRPIETGLQERSTLEKIAGGLSGFQSGQKIAEKYFPGSGGIRTLGGLAGGALGAFF